MLQQVFLDSRYADSVTPDFRYTHWLSDPIVKPEGYILKVHVLSAWIPLTYYNVYEGLYLDVSYALPGIQRITFPPGNRDIDFLLDYINSSIQNDFVCKYDPATNKISFSGGSSILFIEGGTALQMLGLEVNQVGFGVLEAKFGVDLTRTSSILLRSNLHGTNRDPYTRRMSDILCKIPVTREQANEIIEYSQPAFIRITNPSIDHFVFQLTDDDGVPLNLNGNRWTVTIQVSIEKDENHDGTIPRYLENDPIDESPGPPEGESKDEAERGSK